MIWREFLAWLNEKPRPVLSPADLTERLTLAWNRVEALEHTCSNLAMTLSKNQNAITNSINELREQLYAQANAKQKQLDDLRAIIAAKQTIPAPKKAATMAEVRAHLREEEDVPA